MKLIAWNICLILPALSCAYALGQDVVNVRDCPQDMRVGTDEGVDMASVEWPEPKFIDSDEKRVIPLRSHAPGDKFFVGETTVRYTAYYMGTKAMCAFKIVVEDKESPRMQNCPRDVYTTTDPGEMFASGVMWDPPTAVDNTRLVEVQSNPPIGSQFLIGVTRVTYWALDSNRNKGKCEFNVVVEDREGPIFNYCPHNMVINVNPTDTHRTVNWTEPKAWDNGGVARVSSTHRSDSMFPLGTTNVRYSAEDYSGNIGTCSYFVTLRVRVPEDKMFIRNVTSTSIEIAWPETADQSAASYLIYAWPVGEREPPASKHIYQAIGRRESFASRRLGPFKPGEEYQIKIVTAGTGKILQAKQRTKPEPPQSFTVKPGSITSVDFTLLWKPGNGSFDSYTISVRRMTDWTPVLEESVASDLNFFHVSGLEPITGYRVSIRTVSGYADGMTESEEVIILARTAHLPHSGIVVQQMTSDTITIMGRANAVSDRHVDQDDIDDDNNVFLPQLMTSQNNDAHVVFIFSEPRDLFTDVVFNQDVWQYTFRHLQPVTDYTIRVVNNQNGVAFETKSSTKPAPAADLHISAISETTATVQWTHAQGSRDRYEITLSPAPKKGAHAAHREMPIRTRNDVITLTGLEAGTTYEMRIRTTKGKLQSAAKSIQITPGDKQSISMYRQRESTCLSPIIACGFLAAALLVCLLYFLTVFIFSHNIPAKLRNRDSSENEYENPSQHQYSSYLNSLTNRIAQMRRPESNNYNMPLHMRQSRTFSRLPRRTRRPQALHRTQSESVIYYNLSD